MKLEQSITSAFFAAALLMPSVTFAQSAPSQPGAGAPPAGAAGAPLEQPPPYRPAAARPAPGYRPLTMQPVPGAGEAQLGQPYPVYDPSTGQIVLVSPLVQAQRLPPSELPYSENRPVPPGYAVEENHMRGLIIGGAVTLGTLWAISFSVASSNNYSAANGWLAVPVIGPFGWLATRKAPQCNNSYDYGCSDESSNRTLVAFDAIGQLAGAGMLIAGLAITRKHLVLVDPQAAIAVAPYATSRGSGLQLIGQF